MIETAEIFQDHMILQQGKEIRIWGKSDAKAVVSAEIQGKKGEAIADEDGNWLIVLPKLKASDSETLLIQCKSEQLYLNEIAVGEVWIAGGQSNMEFWMRYEKHMEEEKKDCENSKIRFYDIPEVCFDGQRQDFDYSRMAVWRTASKEDLDYFSAVGYFFAKTLFEVLDVPVGIIGCNWGGTTSSVWMSEESVKQVGTLWIEDYQERVSGRDMDIYWHNQHMHQSNDRGNPFEDAFNEFVLPKTPTAEEEKAFFANGNLSFAEVMQDMMPQTIPGCLYEHMVKEAAPFAVRGVLWYQGESDAEPGKCHLYERMLTALIADWRKLWNDEQMTFLVVQLPGWENWLSNGPGNRGFDTIRECQKKVCDMLPNVHLCSISDAGERWDIHPKDKKIVGERLALLAEGHVYGRDVQCDPPTAVRFEREGNKLAVVFENALGGLYCTGDEINALEVYRDEKELPHKTEIKDDRLVITLEDQAENTVEVRFAQTAWYMVNLYNRAGLPAVPFRKVFK